jgi:hypothetical protein
MQYIKTRWIHSCPDDPVWLYSELDADRWEVRKVEVFADGQIGFASSTEHTADTRLGELPIPPNTQIDAEGEFESNVIDKDEFERVWAARLQPSIQLSGS